MSDQVPQQTLDAIDRLTDMCIKDRIPRVYLSEGTLNTFFPREMLADQIQKEIQKEFGGYVDHELQRLYKDVDLIFRIAVQAAFQRYARDVGFDVLQQRANARLEKRMADNAGLWSDVIQAIRATVLPPPIPPVDPSETELRLFMWL